MTYCKLVVVIQLDRMEICYNEGRKVIVMLERNENGKLKLDTLSLEIFFDELFAKC